MLFEVIDLELDLLLRKSGVRFIFEEIHTREFFGVMHLELKTTGCVISLHDTIYQTVMYCGVFLVNGFPQ